MLTTEDLQKIGTLIDHSIAPMKSDVQHVKNDVQHVKNAVTHMSTGIEALAAGQQDIREHMVIKQDVERLDKGQKEIYTALQDVDAKLDKKTKSTERRMEALEEHAGIPNPNKN
jgi:hypothetical protein